jgi:hypothetical protein
MAVTYRIEDGIFILRLAGDFEPADLTDAGERGCREPRFTPPMWLLVDSRESQTTLSTDAIRQSLNRLARMASFHPRVAHVASDALHRALGRMAESYAEIEGIEFRSFNELEQARRWLTSGENP